MVDWSVRRLPTVFAGRPLLIAAAIVPAAVFIVAAAFDFRTERQEVRDQIVATSTALAEHAQTVTETTDLVLARVLDRVAGMDWDVIRTSEELHRFLLQLQAGLPQIDSVFLVAPNGLNVATSRSFPLVSPPSVADRDYFIEAKKGGTGVFVSAPFIGRLQQRFGFSTTQARITNGRFDGLVGVTVSPEYFRRFYAQVVEFPSDATATLVREDGVFLVRYPDAAVTVHALPPDSVFMQGVAAGKSVGMFEGSSALDGRSRIGFYRRLRNQPLFVSYSMNSSAYLRPWRLNLVFIGGFSTVLAAALLLIERAQWRRDEAEKRASAALLQEVERRREAELALEQMQKMEALGRLSGGIAHDFNNLLTAILGPLELATKRITDPRLLRLLTGAMQAAQRGAKLTAQMLAVARKREAAAVTFDPNAAIRDLGDMIARTIGPMIELSYELDPAATPILADPIQFEMALVNLCVNARDAMPGGGHLLLRSRAVTLPGSEPGAAGTGPASQVQISVSDTGEGMAEDVRARALEPFYTTKEPGKGTGLGLSTTYGFVRSASGTLSIDSAPGQGTTVTLSFPRAEGDIAAPEQPAAAVVGRTFGILLVDDDRAVRVATCEMLSEAGHEVVEAAGGAEALDLLGSGRRFDLLVTDFAMPGMDGAQLAAAARSSDPNLRILFVTGYAKGDALADWEHGGATVLDKPFTAAQLARAVADAAGRGTAQAA